MPLMYHMLDSLRLAAKYVLSERRHDGITVEICLLQPLLFLERKVPLVGTFGRGETEGRCNPLWQALGSRIG